MIYIKAYFKYIRAKYFNIFVLNNYVKLFPDATKKIF